MDAGTSGGIWGLQEGYCLMVGGEADVCAALEPIFLTLAPPDGYLRVGDHGAGHYVKMIHNGIEYGLMQAYAEGFELMHESPYQLDLAAVAVALEPRQRRPIVAAGAGGPRARRGSGPRRASKGYVEDSGEGRWTLHEGIDRGVPLPVHDRGALHPIPFAPGQSVRRAPAGGAAQPVRRPPVKNAMPDRRSRLFERCRRPPR